MDADLLELDGDRFQVLGDDVFDEDIPAGGGGRYHEGPGLDLVGDDGILGAVEGLDAADLDDVGARAHDFGPHRV